MLITLLSGAAAQAQTVNEDELLRECYSLRQQGRNDASLPQCERAVSLSRSGRTLAQLALTELALERWDAAATHLAEALDDRAHPWVQQNRAVLEQTLERVRPRVAGLVIETDDGATATLDGRALGTVPRQRPLFLLPGTVTLVVRSRSGEAITRSLTLTTGVTHREAVRFAATASDPRVRPTPRTASVGSSDPGATRRVLAWTSAGLAVAGIGLTLVAWQLREGAVGGYASQCPAGEVDDAALVTRCAGLHAQARQDASQWETLSTVGLVTGGVFAVASAVLFATAPSRRTEAQALRCGGGPGDVGVGCRWSF